MGSRSSWNVYEHQSGSTYTADGTIYRPNADFPMGKTSRMNVVVLADGSIGTVLPSNKYADNLLKFAWMGIYDDDALIAKIEDYVENNTYIKITTHLGEDLIGTFTDIEKTHIVGVDDEFDIMATFLRH